MMVDLVMAQMQTVNQDRIAVTMAAVIKIPTMATVILIRNILLKEDRVMPTMILILKKTEAGNIQIDDTNSTR